MVALAGEVNGQTQRVPDFEPAAVFVNGNGSYPFGIDAADAIGVLNATPDGYPDVVMAIGQLDIHDAPTICCYTGLNGFLAVYRNLQDWSIPANGLAQAQLIDLGPETVPGEVKWAQMTADTKMDIVVAIGTPYPDDQSRPTKPWGIKVFRHTATGFVEHFYLPTTYPVRGLTVADFDNDGDMDVAASVDFLESPDPQKDLIYIALNDGTGILSLTAESPYELDAAGGAPSSGGVGDVVAGNFDLIPGVLQWPDLFSSGENGGTATVVSGSNTGSSVFSFVDADTCAAYLLDIKPGIFTAGHLFDDAIGISSGGLLYLYHGNGNGGFTIDCGLEPNDIYLENTILSFVPKGLDVGHLNGGTKPDVVVADGGGRVITLLGKGDGTLQFSNADGRYFHSTGANHAMRVVLADMDQDGFNDIITSNHGELDEYASLSVLINKFAIIVP